MKSKKQLNRESWTEKHVAFIITICVKACHCDASLTALTFQLNTARITYMTGVVALQ